MHPDKFFSMVPLERYRGIADALSAADHPHDDSPWLRLAAQICVLCPQPINLLADRIHDLADELRRDEHWRPFLDPPARYVIAALLVQHEVSAEEFADDDRRLTILLHEAGLRPGRFREILSVLILRMALGQNLAGWPEIQRLRSIYAKMEQVHWRLTGEEDVPGCAALVQCYGTPAAVMTRFGAAFRELARQGLSGEGQQTAAMLVLLCGADMVQTLQRFQGLCAAFASSAAAQGFSPCDEALVILTLLDQEPQVVIGRLQAVIRELADLRCADHEGDRLLLCASLAFFDLIRFDTRMRALDEAGAVEAMRRKIRAYFLATAVLLSRGAHGPVEAPRQQSGGGPAPGGGRGEPAAVQPATGRAPAQRSSHEAAR